MSSIAPSHPGSVSARMLAAPRVRRPSRLLLAIVVLLGMAPPAYLLQTGGALTTGYEIQKLERERAVWLNRNQQLEVEIARAQSLAWVEHEAVHRLGMQRANQTVVVRVDMPVPGPHEPRLLRARHAQQHAQRQAVERDVGAGAPEQHGGARHRQRAEAVDQALLDVLGQPEGGDEPAERDRLDDDARHQEVHVVERPRVDRAAEHVDEQQREHDRLDRVGDQQVGLARDALQVAPGEHQRVGSRYRERAHA